MKSDLKQLQTIQNKAIKNLFQYERMESTQKIHSENNILTVEQYAHHRTALHVHQILNNSVRSNAVIVSNNQIHKYNTRSATNIHTERIHTKRFGNRQALWKANQIYNELPEKIKKLNYEKFKLESKFYYKSILNF